MRERPRPHLVTWLADIGLVVFGMAMAVTPLALWAAPTLDYFYLALKICGISAFMVWVLADLASPGTGIGRPRPSRLPAKLIEDFQNLRQMGRSGPHHRTLKDFVENRKSDPD